ncbi:MAG: hypothetical protein PVG39_21150 [Desulfobacteraceae bacterium]|jgi:hypothetical protein
MIIKQNESSCSGYCQACGRTHYLKQGKARDYCLELMETLEEKKRIDIDIPREKANPRLSLDYIKGEARGQMFGVLECRDQNDNTIILKAFSGQYNGIWHVEGWAPPMLDVNKYNSLVIDVDKQIKGLGKKINGLHEGPERQDLTLKRKILSQNLMNEIHALYRINNFRSEVKSLFDFFKNRVPTGAGDCCAPKLLNEAAKQNLKPKSLAEIYWGRTNRSGKRLQGNFYAPCQEKCQPIMGFMLCGIER